MAMKSPGRTLEEVELDKAIALSLKDTAPPVGLAYGTSSGVGGKVMNMTAEEQEISKWLLEFTNILKLITRPAFHCESTALIVLNFKPLNCKT